LHANWAPIVVNGTQANLMTYNGQFPAPTIRVHRGDLLQIHMTNDLPSTNETNYLGFQKNFTNLHTHGFHVTPQPPGDFVMYSLAHGETREHEYDTSLHRGGTLSFYHPHKHGLVAEQFWAGLVGALITEDETPVLAGFETHLLILKDITLAGGQPAAHSSMMDYMHGKEGDTVMVNGQVNPRLTIRPGQVQRWRILNASNARFYKLSLEGHTLALVGTDGGLLDQPYPRSQILMSPGERVDVLVQAGATPGNYRLLALPYARMGMMSSAQVTLMTMTIQGAAAADSIPAIIDPTAVRVNMDTAPLPHRTFTLSMRMGRGYINGMDFDVDPFMVMSDQETYEVWTIDNQSGMDHPFHQHVNPAQILSISGADAAYPPYASMPAWKDVSLIPAGGSVTLLVPIKDYSGMTMFHCHILEHEDIGMMGMWNIMPMPMVMPGDLNCDSTISYADINPFVLALTSQTAYEAQFPDCDWMSADCNSDGVVSYADINPFVAMLAGQ
jgi:FtsP/CotA-like multicopper oxidase with cupredoxin domain